MDYQIFKKINYQKLPKIFNFLAIFNFLRAIFNFLTISLFEIRINISHDCVNYDRRHCNSYIDNDSLYTA